MEKAFIKQLETQAYEYVKITNEGDLILNLRKQLEKLNNYAFSDKEWDYFFKKELANPNQSIAEKTFTIQEDFTKILKCDNGTSKNIYLLKKDNIHSNSLQESINMKLKMENIKIVICNRLNKWFASSAY